MTSSAISAQGSAFSINDTGTDEVPVWTKVSNVKSFTGFDGSATELDATDLDSTAKEKLLGLIDEGSFSIDVNVNMADPGQLAMKASQKASSKKTYKLTLPDGTSSTFSAFVKTFPLSGGVDAILSTTIAMTITGPVTDVPVGGGA
ncbi:phage tail tube protein [Paraburkholderia sp. BCC1884]|uniref:phage tail tube protein n=1 Tax=Paraburkholderia sp. BCC1884 TaxID=2562668 RepID=UPI00118392B3|nr:phage tail tube protein [Paraburkholderia sp. BCC1884]